MKATQARPLPEAPKKLTICVNCGNPVTYIYGYVDGGQAVCSRFCDEQYKEKRNAERPAMPEV